MFKDRTDAGQQLAFQLLSYKDQKDVLILALPRGGVVVGYPIAKQLHVPLDVLLVRKLGVPWQPELAMGAIAFGGITVMNEEVVQYERLSEKDIEMAREIANEELERRNKLYRADQPPIDFQNKTIILVDDGVATGSTIKAAIAAIKKVGCNKLVLAIPVAHPSVVAELELLADEVICLAAPEFFYAISSYYQNFEQTTSDEVVSLLAAIREK